MWHTVEHFFYNLFFSSGKFNESSISSTTAESIIAETKNAKTPPIKPIAPDGATVKTSSYRIY